MKDYIISFFVVLAISCFLNSTGIADNIPVGIAGTNDVVGGAKRSEDQIPEINYIDGTSKANQIIGIDESDRHEGSHSQNGNNF